MTEHEKDAEGEPRDEAEAEVEAPEQAKAEEQPKPARKAGAKRKAPEEKAEAAAPEAETAAKVKAAKPRELLGGASPQRPAITERPEAKAAEREPAPAGSIAGLIREALPDVAIEAYQGKTDIIVEVGRDDLPKMMPALKDDPRLNLTFLRCLFGVDFLDDGMDVVYQLASIEKGHEVTIKTRLPKDDLKVASATSVWNAANWHERETRDMFGIEFEGHPHLVPLLLPDDMTDHFPLRKDNPLEEITEWQGEQLVEVAVEDGGGEGETEEEQEPAS
ncbi:MAG: NADH-quinone oxidoreductase subunit C [Dehalococcoidia bacterium]|nr:NADH-quinone oxidoreductase subunit C [Dehalococcoidia bacterium]